jgi:TRAP-type C4-dicarboxylate transport system substrate-binding protein
MKNVIALAALAIAAMPALAQAQTTWDMPTPYAPREFHTLNVQQFVDEVKQATGGQLTVNVHPNGTLIRHADILRAVSTGQVNIAEFYPGTFGNEEAVFDADALPFLISGYDEAWKLYQAQKPALERVLQKRGMRLLYSVPWPPQGIFTKNAIKSVNDIKGAKFRTYSPLQSRFVELLGGSPTVIQPAEVPQAFATGTISMMMTAATTGVATKAWEFSGHLYLTNAWIPKNVVVANARAFQRLPEAQTKALLSAAAAAEKRGWEMSRQREKESNDILAKNGMTLHEPDPAMMAEFQRVGRVVADEWLKKAGADGQQILKNFRGK